MCSLLQQRVTRGVAEPVVNLLEAIQIEQHQHQRLRMALRRRGHVDEAVAEFRAVGQPGETVLQRQPRRGVARLLLRRGVAQDLDKAQVTAFAAVDRIDHPVRPEQRAVLALVPAEVARAALAQRTRHFQSGYVVGDVILGEQHACVCADHLLVLVEEDPRGALVPDPDNPGGIGHDDAVSSRAVEDRLQQIGTVQERPPPCKYAALSGINVETRRHRPAAVRAATST